MAAEPFVMLDVWQTVEIVAGYTVTVGTVIGVTIKQLTGKLSVSEYERRHRNLDRRIRRMEFWIARKNGTFDTRDDSNGDEDNGDH
jgi:hypothetical protein